MPGRTSPLVAPELRLESILKLFGSTRALDGASMMIRPNTVHALLGENGAGKTTLMRVTFGLLRPDAGRVLVDGRETDFRSPADAIRAGIGMVHQHFTNVPAMTVAENIALGGHGRYSRNEAMARVRELTERTQLPLDPEALAASLAVGAQQRLEILKALSRDSRILILDEPTAVLAPAEARDLLKWLRAFADDGGAVVLITHKLSEALSAADDVTVLRHGRTVLTTPAASSSPDDLARSMLGERPAVTSNTEAFTAVGDVVLSLKSVSLVDSRGVVRVHNASLEVRQGEVVGIAALENSGHDLLLRAIAGRILPTSGVIERRGATALIPEDRQREALVLPFSVTENVTLKSAGSRRGRIEWGRQRELASRLAREYDVRAASVASPVASLSGGNQQKLVLARELSEQPAIIVAENPTRGLDLRATADVHARLRDAAQKGAAVIVHSTDLDEVLMLATRVVAVHQGRLLQVPNDREIVGRAMLGLA
jgi:general nucleoside transport system ATP-binding protein